MTQTIKQLTARVRGLDEENARLKEIEQTNDTLLDQLGDKNAALLDEVASQKHCYAEAVAHYEKQLAASQLHAEQLRVAIDRVRSGAAALGLDRIFDIATEALALHRDTSALDAYVSEKVKEALKWAADVLPPIDPGELGVCVCPVCRALSTIKESEAK